MYSALRRRCWIVRRRLEGWKVMDIAEALRAREKLLTVGGASSVNIGGKIWR